MDLFILYAYMKKKKIFLIRKRLNFKILNKLTTNKKVALSYLSLSLCLKTASTTNPEEEEEKE